MKRVIIELGKGEGDQNFFKVTLTKDSSDKGKTISPLFTPAEMDSLIKGLEIGGGERIKVIYSPKELEAYVNKVRGLFPENAFFLPHPDF